MSTKSQEHNMRRLSVLLGKELGYIYGENERGPNGEKKTFLRVGKVFLRALAKDLGLHDAKISSNTGGIAVSGTCTLIGMWADSGIHVWIEQPVFDKGNVLCYRTVRHIRDYKGGYNHYITRSDLKEWSYDQLLTTLNSLRKDGYTYERAA